MSQEKNRILMICYSKGRPHRIGEMIESFDKTKGLDTTDIIFCLDNNDSKYFEYEPVLRGRKVISMSPNYATKAVDKIVKGMGLDYDYWGVVNDDHIFRTENWDKEFVRTLYERSYGVGLVSANTLWFSSDITYRHPGVFIMNWEISQKMDYVFPPAFNNFSLDTFLRDLFEPLGLIYYREDIIIEHMHAHQNKAELDETYRWGYSQKEMANGILSLANWTIERSEIDRKVVEQVYEEAKQKGESNE